MELKKLKLTEIKPYGKNPRKNDGAVDAVAESIKQCGYCSPIVVDENYEVLAGHTRLKALKKLGRKECEVVVKEGLTEEQKQKYRILDNKTGEFAEWDLDILQEQLKDLDFEGFDFGFADIGEMIDTGEEELIGGGENHSLNQVFIVPPFSVLDTRKGYWQDRKRQWLQKTGNLAETKENVLYSSQNFVSELKDGSSEFDPVLAELIMRWFNTENGKILDCFGGEQTKGVVAGELGYEYYACEIRPEQVAIDKQKTKDYKTVHYFCGDSNNISSIIKERGFDLVFTSPPYYDLEIYSKEDMSALGTYEEFMSQYKNIFKQCYDMMSEEGFLVVKIGEIRNKRTGEYRNFVGDNISIFKEIGFKYYNEIILVTQVGTVARTVTRAFNTSRKIGKVHQNVLVFYKGNLKNIKNKYKELDFSECEGLEDEV